MRGRRRDGCLSRRWSHERGLSGSQRFRDGLFGRWESGFSIYPSYAVRTVNLVGPFSGVELPPQLPSARRVWSPRPCRGVGTQVAVHINVVPRRIGEQGDADAHGTPSASTGVPDVSEFQELGHRAAVTCRYLHRGEGSRSALGPDGFSA